MELEYSIVDKKVNRCAKCGSPAYVLRFRATKPFYRVFCNNPDINECIAIGGRGNTVEEAIELWNQVNIPDVTDNATETPV